MKDLSSKYASVLIVEDNVQYARILQRMLNQVFGYREVVIAEEVDEALGIVQSAPERFQLLFVDYNFPSGKTGGDFLRALSEQALLEGKISFLITADPTPENVTEARRAGAFGVVSKPFDRELLGEQLEKAERYIRSLQVESF